MLDGVAYFPLACVMDDRYKLIEAEYGLTGFAVLVKLLQKIYGVSGYYYLFTDEVALLFSHDNGLGGNVVSEIIKSAVKRGIFDKDIYDKYSVLTSKEIQDVYFTAIKRRKNFKIVSEYLLGEYAQIFKNADKNTEIACKNDKNVCKNKQSKVKESKVKESKGKESKVKCSGDDTTVESVESVEKYGDYVKLTKAQYDLLCNDYGEKNILAEIDRINDYLKRSGKEPYQNHFTTLKAWLKQDGIKKTNFNLTKVMEYAKNTPLNGIVSDK